MGFLDLFRSKNVTGKAKVTARVVVTEQGITHYRPDGTEETIRWTDLAEVGIMTTDEGPLVEDVFFMLMKADPVAGLAIPQGAEGTSELVQRLQTLPGFDSNAVIKAMGSTSNAKFICWKKSPV